MLEPADSADRDNGVQQRGRRRGAASNNRCASGGHRDAYCGTGERRRHILGNRRDRQLTDNQQQDSHRRNSYR